MTGRFRPLPVWSGWQRVIHWAIAISVLIMIPLGLLLYLEDALELTREAKDAIMAVHASVGFVFASSALARIIYLFTGPPASRLADVVPHTKKQLSLGFATLRYYLSGFKGRAPLYVSHNPLAGAFDTVLFAVFITQALSGMNMFLFHGEAHVDAGGTHAHPGSWPPEWFGEVHELGALVIIAFVVSHLAALAVHDVFERRGLVSSMISGRKFFTEEELKEAEGELSSRGIGPE